MPLQAAQDAADELFGKFASYAMTHRAEIKKMSAARAQALKDAREQGAQRETHRSGYRSCGTHRSVPSQG